MESEQPQSPPKITIETFFGSLPIRGDIEPYEVQRNLRALDWIEQIVDGSNGGLEYEVSDDRTLVVGVVGHSTVKVDVLKCAERSLEELNYMQGHVPAFVDGAEICIQMSEEAHSEVPDLDLCVALLLLMNANGVKPEHLPTTLYSCLPLSDIKAMFVHEDESVIQSAIDSLGCREGAAAKRLLKQCVYQAKEPTHILAALEAIVFGRHSIKVKPYLPLIVEYTRHVDHAIKVRAIELFGLTLNVKDKALLPVMRRLVRFNHHSVQHLILNSYARMAGSDSVEDFIFLLKHRDEDWQHDIIHALCEIGSASSKQVLIAHYPKAAPEIQSIISTALLEECTCDSERAAIEFLLAINHTKPVDDLSSIDASLRFD